MTRTLFLIGIPEHWGVGNYPYIFLFCKSQWISLHPQPSWTDVWDRVSLFLSSDIDLFCIICFNLQQTDLCFNLQQTPTFCKLHLQKVGEESLPCVKFCISSVVIVGGRGIDACSVPHWNVAEWNGRARKSPVLSSPLSFHDTSFFLPFLAGSCEMWRLRDMWHQSQGST